MQILLCFIFVILNAAVSFSADLIQSQYASIAKIQSNLLKGLSAPGGIGTGVLLEKNHGFVLTNIHVIVTCFDALGETNPWQPSNTVVGKTCPLGTLNIIFPNVDGMASTAEAKIIAIGNPAHLGANSLLNDWVILQINPAIVKNIPVLKAFSRELIPGESIHFAGFPAAPVGEKLANTPGFYSSAGQILSSSYASEVSKSIYESLNLSEANFNSLRDYTLNNLFNNTSVFFHDALIIGGYSGSPVFDQSGIMVGIIFGNASAWDYNFGEYPAALGADASNPSKPANKLSTGVLLKSICENLSVDIKSLINFCY